MERGRQRRDDARHAGRRPEGNEEGTDRGTGRRVDQKAREGSGPVHQDPSEGDYAVDRKGSELPAEYSGLPGAVQDRISGGEQGAKIRAEGRKRPRADHGAEPAKKPLNKAKAVRFLECWSPHKQQLSNDKTGVDGK